MCNPPSIVNVSFQRKYLIFLVTLYSFAFAQSGYGQVVSTLAGDGLGGFLDGTGTGSRFWSLYGVCNDGAGNLYVADRLNHRIRKIEIATGIVTTVAGSTSGFTDGVGALAQFNTPQGVCVDGSGNLFVGDSFNSRIRKVVLATGAVTTLAGSSLGFMDGTGTAARFNQALGLCSDGTNLYVADQGNHRIRKIEIATGIVTTIAGNTSGFMDGIGSAAQFNTPQGICLDGAGNLFVTDLLNHRIRKIVIATGTVTTIAGNGTAGFMNGVGTAALFNSPAGICADGLGNLFIADQGNDRIRKVVTATGVVTTIAGSSNGFTDGAASTARFNYPSGLTIDGTDNLYVGDLFNNRVRKITLVKSAAYSAATFPESAANNGTFTTTQDVTLTGDTWLPAGAFSTPADFTATGVPAGLTLAINRISATVARISFTGTAAAHANANDATVTLNFTNAALTGNNATSVTGLNPASLTLDFNDPPSTAYSALTFPEAITNDGSITQTRTITLTGETWNSAVVNGTNFTAGTHFTAANVPTGLTMVIQKTSANVATVSFTGNAAAHANANDISTVQITWLAAATQDVLPVNITGLNGVNLTLDFNDPPTSAYSALTFPEAITNDGSITQTRTITLTGETWNTGITNGANFTVGTHFTAANVPAGLTMVIQKTSANVATVSFTGNATAHANANDVTNVQITWLAAATQDVAPALITGLNGVNLTLDFNDPGGVVWSGTTFAEAAANNGTITATQTVTLTADAWNTGVANGTNFTAGTHFTVANVPAGLTMVLTKNSATQVTVSFIGAATAHANANDVTNVQITFLNVAVNSGNASGNTGLNGVNITIDFNDPATAAYSGTVFPEAAPNNGTITQTRDVTLTGDTWLPAGAFANPADFTATGVPMGLSIAINRISATVARISFTGTAAAHANANDATVTLNFTNAALTSNNAAVVTGLNTASLTLDFNDPAAVAPTIFTLASPPAVTVGTPYSFTFAADGSPAPSYTLVSGMLPPGLSLSPTGVLSGTPTASGTFGPFVVRATNIGGSVNTAPVTMTVNASVQPPQLTPPIFSGGIVSGTAYSASLGLPFTLNARVVGNPLPSLSVSDGELPPGITLSNGILTGLPTAQGAFTFTLQATNSEGSAAITVTVNVGAAVPLIASVTPSSGVYGSTITISGYNLNNVTAVSIGGIPVQSFRTEGGVITAVVGAGSGQIAVTTPLGSTSGGGNFALILPEKPVLMQSVLPNVPTGDENVVLFLAGRNIPSFATVAITPVSASGATLGVSLPVPMSAISETGATLIVPVAARLAGFKRLTLNVLDVTVSATFAVVLTQPPMVQGMSVSSTTASGAAFTTTIMGKGFFRNGLARFFVNGEETFFASVLSANEARVEIPERLNVRGGLVGLRMTNFDGQSTEATISVIGRTAPLITSAAPRWVNGNLSFVVRGLAFSPRLTAILGWRNVVILRASDTEFEFAVPQEYYGLTTPGTISLLITNPDGQRYGFLLSTSFFQPPTTFNAVIQPKNGGQTTNNFGSSPLPFLKGASEETPRQPSLLILSPNPASETLTAEIPCFTGAARLQILNARGEEMILGMVSGGEQLTFDVHSLASGVYFVRLMGENIQTTQQITVVR